MAEKLTGPELSALQHWSLYGRPSEPSQHRVGADEWTTEPFVAPVTSPWDIPISSEQLPILLVGFLPREMEDKWFVYADGPDAEGRVRMHLHRSWTGFKMAEIDITVMGEALAEQSKQPVEPLARITGITWESSEASIRGNTEEGAKKGALDVFRYVLRVNLNAEDKK